MISQSALLADTFNQTTPEHYNIINIINSTKHVISQLIGWRAVTVTFVSRSMLTVTVARPGTVQVPWSPRCWAQVAWVTVLQGVPQVCLHFVTIFSCSKCSRRPHCCPCCGLPDLRMACDIFPRSSFFDIMILNALMMMILMIPRGAHLSWE